jgi:ketosteroid isomerase-like protein
MTQLNAEIVRAEVARFWNAFTTKSAETLEDFYAHESSVFGSTASRAEPGRLAATRRKREYFTPQATLRAQTGPIDVVMLGSESAVASYTFQFHATKVSGVLAKASEEHIAAGRATQVFGIDNDGEIRIFHEHFSLPLGTS